MKQMQAECYLEMMRYQDVNWRNVHIGKLVKHFNEREHLISEMSEVMQELMVLALDHPGELVSASLHEKYSKLLKEV